MGRFDPALAQRLDAVFDYRAHADERSVVKNDEEAIHKTQRCSVLTDFSERFSTQPPPGRVLL